jgi:Ni,Fe-hydrogenase III component G
MTTRRFHAEPIDFERQPGCAAPIWHGRATDGEDLLRYAISVHRHDGRLCALWGSDERANGNGFRVHVVFALDEGWQTLILDLPEENPVYPDLSGVFAAANRMQRATFDLVGIRHDGEDQRPWLRHGGWPADWFPLRHDAGEPPAHENLPTDYEFVKVGGEGAHEIPVGPIHAGIIEPGHFRFTVVGERVLRLEQPAQGH